MSFITIESHFGVPGNQIRASTRNKCSDDFIIIIQEITTILYPEENFEIYLLPSEDGSYKDVLKIVGATSTLLISVAGVSIAYLNYIDSHEGHLINKEFQCIELREKLQEIDLDDISYQKINEVCNNALLAKRKNNRYFTLKGDDMISYEETILKNEEKKILYSQKILRIQFDMCIDETINDEKEYVIKDLEGVIELISLVVKQKREGKGIPWKGTYFGKEIINQDVQMLQEGEEINFYMQDSDFKRQIDENEIKFTNGDNIRVIFSIKGILRGGILQNKSIYVSHVKSFNEDVIVHTIKQKNISNIPEDQQSLFTNLDT